MKERRSRVIGKMTGFKGISINPGRIVGSICLYSAELHKAVKEYSLSDDAQIAGELVRFEEALQICSDELETIALQVEDSIGKAESEIFITQKHIMNDSKVVESVKYRIMNDRKNVEWAISEVLKSYEDRFASLDNEYLRDRASDIGEVRRRILDRITATRGGLLCEGQAHCRHGENRVIVAHELTAAMITNLNLDRVLGIVTEHGGITSHAAIIARSLGVTAVTGVHGIMEIARCGDKIAINGDSGEVYINPDSETVASIFPVEPVRSEDVCMLGTPPGMTLLANASTMEDVKLAAQVGADGIGLFRTEILFIKEDRLLDEEEQFAYYRKIVETIQGKEVTFRMLDAGGDKPLSFLHIKKEENPYLGWRGSRFLLGNQHILVTQVRALARVSRIAPVKILFPMVIDSEQLRTLLELAKRSIAEAGIGGDRIQFGAMFEVPSAFLEAEEIFSQVDFASIGSNDLIQYLFAIDRNNELVSQEYKPEHPALWKMLARLSAASVKEGKPLSICGELAARDGFQHRLLDIGITSLSVPPRLLPRVRNEMARYAGLLT